MNISIVERLRPFSHLPGASMLLPGSGWPVKIYPAMIKIYQFNGPQQEQVAELQLGVKGPVEQFTVFNDLEKGCVVVTGMTEEGWMRYRLIASEQLTSLRLIIDRAPKGELRIYRQCQETTLKNGEWLDLFHQSGSFAPYVVPHCDRLSFGCHKAQDWDLLRRRENLEEIFPLWHRLGQLVPQCSFPQSSVGMLSLLEACRTSSENKDEMKENWKKLFLSGFDSILVPQWEDTHFQGILLKLRERIDCSPLVILSEGARLIRELFIRQDEGVLSILPILLPCFPFGRLTGAPLVEGGSVSLEWSKKAIRRMILTSDQDNEIRLHLPSQIKTYRLKKNSKDKGEKKGSSESLFLQKGCCYYFDNFE